MDLLSRLREGIVLCAEGYVFELERRGYIQAPEFIPEAVLDNPDAVKQLHKDFAFAGSDVMVALTYYSDRKNLSLINRQDQLEQFNRQALKIAKSVALDNNLLLAGNIGDTHIYNPNNHNETSNLIRSIYTEQAKIAKEEGANFIIAETLDYLGEALVALEVIKSMDMRAVITFGSHFGKIGTSDGYTFPNACKILEANGADVVGLNCVMGPQTMLPVLRQIRETIKGYMAALPVPYNTTDHEHSFMGLKRRDGKPAFPANMDSLLLDRGDMADFAIEAKNAGVNYLGICCGSGPHHVRAMAEALGRQVPGSRYSPLPYRLQNKAV